MQLEERRLTLKIGVSDRSLRRDMAAKAESWLLNNDAFKTLGFKRPKVIRSGEYTTLAELSQGYLQQKSDGTLDFDATLTLLHHITTVCHQEIEHRSN
jgi:hypothetical protein